MIKIDVNGHVHEVSPAAYSAMMAACKMQSKDFANDMMALIIKGNLRKANKYASIIMTLSDALDALCPVGLTTEERNAIMETIAELK